MAQLPDPLQALLSQAEADLETAQAKDAVVATAATALDSATKAKTDADAEALASHQTANASATAAINGLKQYFNIP